MSGGKSSATIEDMFPADFLVFALVRTSNPKCLFPDKKIRQLVSDRIGKEFVGTLEDDTIIYTMLDLEQYFGKPIDWVSGLTFEEIIEKKSFYPPNRRDRFCTTFLKIDPIFYWWHEKFNREIVKMSIGYRQGEHLRVKNMIDKLNRNGLDEYEATFEKNKRGQNKWEVVPWRKLLFPLAENGIDKIDVANNWKGKPVRFAPLNNCIGCFHRKPSTLNRMSRIHPDKFDVFISMEDGCKGTFKKNTTYQGIKDGSFTINAFDQLDDEGCGSGFCGF